MISLACLRHCKNSGTPTKAVRTFYTLFVIILITAFGGHSKNLYVAPAGNDATSYSENSITKPWKSPLCAWTNAKAGDSVFFRAGTYTIATQIWTKFYGNAGRENAPIVFKNYPHESVYFKSTVSSRVAEKATIIIEKSYNEVSGISFLDGATWFCVGYDMAVDHFTISHCTVKAGFGGDNVAFVNANGASNVTISGCTIRGPGLGRDNIHLNTAGVIAFNALGLKILHCTITNVPIGIYYKHGQKLTKPSGIEIAFNFIDSTDRYSMELNTMYALVHDNVVGSTNGPLQLNESNGGPNGDYNTLSHNTLFGGQLILSDDDNGALHNTIINNIFTKPIEIHITSQTPHFTTLNNNLYCSDIVVSEFGDNYTLSSWQQHSLEDKNSTYLKSISLMQNPKSIEDYALLKENSQILGSDQRPVGAYIEGVGINGINAPLTPLNFKRIR